MWVAMRPVPVACAAKRPRGLKRHRSGPWPTPSQSRPPRQALQAGRGGGQVTLEYFLLFAAVALATLITISTFDDGVSASLQHLVNDAAAKIAH